MNDIQKEESSSSVQVKVSRLAIIAIICAILGIVFVPYIARNSDPEYYDNLNITSITFLRLAGYLSLSLLLTSVILGFVSHILIEKSGGKVTGRGFAVGAIVLSIIGGCLLILWISTFFARLPAFRILCGTNLSGLGKAMLIYANDYDDKLPSQNITWGTSVKWDAATQQEAYGLNQDGTGGSATISSFLYLLVKYAEVPPKSFICAGDKQVSEFKSGNYGIKNGNITDFWDFGSEPWKHNSYAYQMSFGKNALTTSNNSDIAIASDRNPWIASRRWKIKNFNSFNPDGDKEMIQQGNAPTHANQGQNVLYLDSHVEFESVSFCGVNQDNIYTSRNGSDIRKGTPPVLGSQPAGNMDSLLVNDPPVKKP
ncbi:MAG: DUF4190 domain-containing protein [Sedimentisphaerales bacterium]|nr:DUF4190 domain-containing protein [Sedimentisphaerales bacterium]